MDHLPPELRRPLVDYILSVADDKFILGHRNADWTGLAPILEEDIAFSSLSQDEIAHASALYDLCAGLLNTTANKLAYGRQPAEYRCAQIVELSDEFNWATAIARNFFCDHFDAVRLERMSRSNYVPLAQLAGRLAAEEQIHVEHVDGWMRRLGRGGAEARERMQTALNDLAKHAATLFEPTEGMDRLVATGVLPKSDAGHFTHWVETLQKVTDDAGLTLRLSPLTADFVGGRRGKQSDGFGVLLDELTEVYRLEPEAAW